MAPFDGRFQGPVPRQGGPAATGQQPEPVAEPGRQLRHGQRADPGRGEFDGQRYAVELAADFADRRDVLAGQAEPGPGQRGPVAEQPDRFRLGRRPRICHLGLRYGQRRHRPARLPRHAQPGLAGRQDAEPGAASKKRRDRVGGGLDDVLAVVHDEQGLGVTQPGDDAAEEGLAWFLPDRQVQCDGGHHQIRLADRGQLDQPHPTAVPP